MARQIVTQDQISRLLAAGADELRVDADAIITDVAAELAQERGLRILRGGEAAVPRDTGGPLREKIRSAVVAALGTEPEQLDAVLDRVLKG